MLEPMKREKSKRPMVPVPKHSPETLLRFLGIEPEDIAERESVDERSLQVADQIVRGNLPAWLLG